MCCCPNAAFPHAPLPGCAFPGCAFPNPAPSSPHFGPRHPVLFWPDPLPSLLHSHRLRPALLRLAAFRESLPRPFSPAPVFPAFRPFPCPAQALPAPPFPSPFLPFLRPFSIHGPSSSPLSESCGKAERLSTCTGIHLRRSPSSPAQKIGARATYRKCVPAQKRMGRRTDRNFAACTVCLSQKTGRLPFLKTRPAPPRSLHSRQALLHWPGRTGVRQSGGRTCTGRGACPVVRQSGSCAPRMFRFRPIGASCVTFGNCIPRMFLSPESIAPLTHCAFPSAAQSDLPQILQVRKKRTEKKQ